MNAAPLVRHLTQDGVEPKLAHALAEHLADEIERTVATKDHVDSVVTREVQNLRVEMHEFRVEITRQVNDLRVELAEKLSVQFRWLLGWLALVTVGILLDLFR